MGRSGLVNQRLILATVALALLLLATSSGGVLVSSAQTTICKMPVDGLKACKPAVTPPKPSRPTPACCAALSKADMRCLCSFKNSPVLPSLGIDPKLAFKLPAKCKLSKSPPC